MAVSLRNPWICRMLLEELGNVETALAKGLALDKHVETLQESGKFDAVMVRLTKSRRVQVLDIQQNKGSMDYEAILSDKFCSLQATFYRPAVHEFETRKQEIGRISGGIIGLEDYEIKFDPNNTSTKRLRMVVRQFKLIGSEGSPTFGKPQDAAADQEIQPILGKLGELLVSQLDGKAPGRFDHTSSNEASSAEFATQIQPPPTNTSWRDNRLVEPHIRTSKHELVKILKQNSHLEEASSSGKGSANLALSGINVARGASGLESLAARTRENAPEIKPKIALPHKEVLSTPIEPLSLKRKRELQRSNRALPPAQSPSPDSASQNNYQISINIPTKPKQKSPRNGIDCQVRQRSPRRPFLIDEFQICNPFAGLKRVPRRYLQISRQQQDILDRESSWYEPEDNERSRYANIPSQVREDLEKSFNTKARVNSRDGSDTKPVVMHNSLEETTDDEEDTLPATVNNLNHSFRHGPTSERDNIPRNLPKSKLYELSSPDSSEEVDTPWSTSPIREERYPSRFPHQDAVAYTSSPIRDDRDLSGSPQQHMNYKDVQMPQEDNAGRLSSPLLQSFSESIENMKPDNTADRAPSSLVEESVNILPSTKIPKTCNTNHMDRKIIQADFFQPSSPGGQEDFEIEVPLAAPGPDNAKQEPIKSQGSSSRSQESTPLIQVEQTPVIRRHQNKPGLGLSQTNCDAARHGSSYPTSSYTVPATFNDFRGPRIVDNTSSSASVAQRSFLQTGHLDEEARGRASDNGQQDMQDPQSMNEKSEKAPEFSIPHNMVKPTQHGNDMIAMEGNQNGPGDSNINSSPPQIPDYSRKPSLLRSSEPRRNNLKRPKDNAEGHVANKRKRIAEMIEKEENTSKATAEMIRESRRLSRKRLEASKHRTFPEISQHNVADTEDDLSNGDEHSIAATQTVYEEFKTHYPDYKGNRKQFTWALVYIEWLDNQDKTVHDFFCDDFIRVLASEYETYMGENRGKPRSELLTGWKFYNKFIHKPIYLDKVIYQELLSDALVSLDTEEVDRYRRVFSPNIPRLEGDYVPSTKDSTPVPQVSVEKSTITPTGKSKKIKESNYSANASDAEESTLSHADAVRTPKNKGSSPNLRDVESPELGSPTVLKRIHGNASSVPSEKGDSPDIEIIGVPPRALSKKRFFETASQLQAASSRSKVHFVDQAQIPQQSNTRKSLPSGGIGSSQDLSSNGGQQEIDKSKRRRSLPWSGNLSSRTVNLSSPNISTRRHRSPPVLPAHKPTENRPPQPARKDSFSNPKATPSGRESIPTPSSTTSSRLSSHHLSKLPAQPKHSGQPVHDWLNKVSTDHERKKKSISAMARILKAKRALRGSQSTIPSSTSGSTRQSLPANFKPHKIVEEPKTQDWNYQ